MKGLYQLYTELYHGTMADFKEFNLDHVGESFGTGFGYGIYVSEIQKVAKNYIKHSKGKVVCKLDGVDTSNTIAKLVGGIHYSLSKNSAKMLEILKQLAPDRVTKGELTPDDLNTINGASTLKYFSGGFVYNIELVERSEPYDFLNWDNKPTPTQLDKINNNNNSTSHSISNIDTSSNMNLYNSIAKDSAINGQRNASKFLLDCGIDGIKYSENGYYNYVIFDPKSLKIVKRVAY